MPSGRDYIFGTHDDETARLGLQNAVWRPRATDAWRRAGISAGHAIIDVGCGPGFASLDLSEIAGANGMVHAIDRSRKFLDTLEFSATQRGIKNIITHECDFNENIFPEILADAAWCRWIFAFVKNPRALLENIARSLKPGGVLVFHEYFDYSTWRMIPRSAEHEEFVRIVMESWRADGGEPDIGVNLSVWLGELRFEIREITPVVHIIAPDNFLWQWPKSFINIGTERLVQLGYLPGDRGKEIVRAFAANESAAGVRMITPGVMEVIAVKQ